MIRKIVTTFLFFFISNPIFNQLNDIKSIKLESLKQQQASIIFDKNDNINISFDILGEKKSDYYFTITHCDYKWNPSQISKFEYIDGFDDIRINDYFFRTTHSSHTQILIFKYPIKILKLNLTEIIWLRFLMIMII